MEGRRWRLRRKVQNARGSGHHTGRLRPCDGDERRCGSRDRAAAIGESRVGRPVALPPGALLGESTRVRRCDDRHADENGLGTLVFRRRDVGPIGAATPTHDRVREREQNHHERCSVPKLSEPCRSHTRVRIPSDQLFGVGEAHLEQLSDVIVRERVIGDLAVLAKSDEVHLSERPQGMRNGRL